MYEFKLPDLGEGIHEGEVLQWYVKVGDAIAEDAPLVEIETDKAAVTIPSPKGGIVVALNGDVGEAVVVGSVLVTIDVGNERPEQTATADVVNEAAERPAAISIADPVVASPVSSAAELVRVVARTAPAGRKGPIPAAPATRRLARELNVALADVPASGPAGRVTAADVRQFASHGATSESGDVASVIATPDDTATRSTVATVPGASGVPFLEIEPFPDFEAWGSVEVEPVRSIRRIIAKKMVTSMVLVPHVAHMDEADVTELDALRRAERERLGQRLSLLPFIMKAAIACLREFPMFNASLDPLKEQITYKKYFNIGIAADTPKGLMVPVVKNADQLSALQLYHEVQRLAETAREGRIARDDMQGGSFTITNVGAIGGTGMVPTINYPEVAILGLARAADKAVVRNGEIVIRRILPMTLCFDHRIADGANAARFMNKLVHLLSNPAHLLLEG